jgi:hypothetical protein
VGRGPTHADATEVCITLQGVPGEALQDKGMSKGRAAKIANAPNSSKHVGKSSGSGGNRSQGGTSAPKKRAGRKGGKASSKS